MKKILARWGAGACLSCLFVAAIPNLFTGCASDRALPVNAGVEVPGDPPALVDETVPPSPGFDYYWIGGSWVWNNRWVWQPGRWERPPHQGAMWIPDRYVYRGGHHIFIKGGWQ